MLDGIALEEIKGELEYVPFWEQRAPHESDGYVWSQYKTRSNSGEEKNTIYGGKKK